MRLHDYRHFSRVAPRWDSGIQGAPDRSMRGFRFLLVTAALAASALAACTAETDGDEEQGDVGLGEAAVTSLDPNGAQPVAITDPAALRELEKRGFGFGHHFGVADDVRADVLQTTPGWSSIAHGISVNL